MKNLYILFALIFLLGPILKAQEFAPIGAQWKFDKTFAFSGDVSIYTFNATGDTTILNKNCRVIHIDAPSCSHQVSGDQFVYESNDTIFHYDADENKFDRILIFNTEVGDSWFIQKSDGSFADSMKCVVDSISIRKFEMDSLKVYHVCLAPVVKGELMPYCFESQIIEKIGFQKGMLPDRFNDICDGPFISDIRCYEDDETGLLNFRSYDCDFISSTDNASDQDGINVYPNPFSNFLNIDTPGFTEKINRIKIFGLDGATYYESNYTPSLITADLLPGFYIMTIETKNGTFLKKLIKQ